MNRDYCLACLARYENSKSTTDDGRCPKCNKTLRSRWQVQLQIEKRLADPDYRIMMDRMANILADYLQEPRNP